MTTSSGHMVRSFVSYFSIYLYNVLRTCSGVPTISSSGWQVNDIFKPRACVHCSEALEAILHISQHGCTFSFNLNIQAVLVLSFIHFLVFGFVQARNWGTVRGTQTGLSEHSFYLIN